MGNCANLLVFACISLQLLVGAGVFGQESKTSSSPNPCATKKEYIVFNNSPRSFLDAWRFCSGHGMRLATINSADDSRLVEEAIQQSSNPNGTWWIGGTDLGQEGSFIWISTNLPVGYKTGYSNFAPGQPDNYKNIENCLEIGRYGLSTWNDMPCEEKLRFVCEDSAVGDI